MGTYPAHPDNEYGWETLYAERAVYTFARRHGFAPRVARFENCYGPLGTWRGGREKAPAAIARKVAEARDGGTIDVYGGGATVRSFVYVTDLAGHSPPGPRLRTGSCLTGTTRPHHGQRRHRMGDHPHQATDR